MSLLRRSKGPQKKTLAHVMTAAPGQGRPYGAATPPPGARASWCPHPGRLTQSLATGFHRFLTRFSGRRRSKLNYRIYPPPWSFLVVVLVSSLVSIVDACSSRTIPRPRRPTASAVPQTTVRPDIVFREYECPSPYAEDFCLNKGVCFLERINGAPLYYCRCANGFLGDRCQLKDLDGSYLHSQGRYILETASVAGGATVAVFTVVVICVMAYLKWRRRKKYKISQENVNIEEGGEPKVHERLGYNNNCVSEGGELGVGPCPVEVAPLDPALLDRGDHKVGSKFIRTHMILDSV